jgi:hypothetical protein
MIIISIIITINIIMLLSEKKDMYQGWFFFSVGAGVFFFLWRKKSKSEANDTHTNLRPRLKMSGSLRPNLPTLLTCVGKSLPT